MQKSQFEAYEINKNKYNHPKINYIFEIFFIEIYLFIENILKILI